MRLEVMVNLRKNRSKIKILIKILRNYFGVIFGNSSPSHTMTLMVVLDELQTTESAENNRLRIYLKKPVR